MIIELKEKKDEGLSKIYNQAMQELNKFFEINWKYGKPNVFLVQNRKEIDALFGKKTENWVIAWSDRDIFLLDKKNIEKESCHTSSKKTIKDRVKHELAHSFFKILSSGNIFPLWLNEGVGTYVIEKRRNNPKKFKEFLSFYSTWKSKLYDESYFAVKLLIEKFGKTKLIKLIKSLENIKSEKEFEISFKRVYKEFPTYNFFNKLLENKK